MILCQPYIGYHPYPDFFGIIYPEFSQNPEKQREKQGLTPLVGLLVVWLSIRQSSSTGCQLEILQACELPTCTV